MKRIPVAEPQSISALKILIVDDEPELSDSVSWRLEQAGFEVTASTDGRAALDAVEEIEPDLVLLDLVLPRMSGMDVLRELRSSNTTLPVILISGRSEETDRIAALEIGADDFVVKPFSPRELVARIRSAVRRTQRFEPGPSQDTIVVGDLVIDIAGRRAVLDGEDIKLSSKEFLLLATLARHPGKALAKAELLEKAWPESTAARPEATLTEHVSRLRRKLESDPASPKRLVTVHGVGYSLRS